MLTEMPHLRAIKSSIEELCIEMLAKDKKVQNDFRCLSALPDPQIAFQVLKRKLNNHENLQIHHIDQLVSSRLQNVELVNWNDPDMKLMEELVKVLNKKKCQLETLKLYWGNHEALYKTISDLLPSLGNLKEIGLSSHGDFPYTNDLIRALGQCPSLQSLDFNMGFEKLEIHSIEFMLLKFKLLKRLFVMFSNGKINKALCRLHEADTSFSTGLESITWEPNEEDDLKFEAAISSMVCVKRVNILKTDGITDLNCLIRSTASIKMLNITLKSPNSLDYELIAPVIECHRDTLDEVIFECVENINMPHLIRHCPHLTLLDIEWNCSFIYNNNDEEEIPPSKKLLHLRISYPIEQSDEKIWFALLSEATKLIQMVLIDFDGAILQRTLKKVYELHNFPGLMRLFLIEVDGITIKDLLPMIETSDNPLKRVCFEDCSGINKEELMAYKLRMEPFKVVVKCEDLDMLLYGSDYSDDNDYDDEDSEDDSDGSEEDSESVDTSVDVEDFKESFHNSDTE